MTWDCFVIGEILEVKFGVQVGRAQINPEMTGLFTIDRASPALRTRRARFNFWRNTGDLQKAGNQSGKCFRH